VYKFDKVERLIRDLLSSNLLLKTFWKAFVVIIESFTDGRMTRFETEDPSETYGLCSYCPARVLPVSLLSCLP
jgi:hypothetical protein